MTSVVQPRTVWLGDASPEVVAADLRAAWDRGTVDARLGRPRNPPYTDPDLALAWAIGWDHVQAADQTWHG